MGKENLAAIDLGTNSCRLLITDKNGNIILSEATNTKLGEGMYKNNCFTEEAIERGLACFKRFASLMEDYEVGVYRAVATAACRMASNGMEFVRQVKEQSGVELEVISSEEEAILNLKGAMANASSDSEYVVVYDLGGGSTEITLAKKGNEPEVIYTISIPWGARNASEAFDLAIYNEDNAGKLRNEVCKYTDEFLKNSELEKCWDKCCFIATSSTPLRLFSMIEDTGVYNKYFADGLTENTATITQVIDGIFKMSLDEMIDSPYIGNNRGPIFVAACVIFKTIYEELKMDKITASLKGAQEAIIMDLEKKWQS